MFGPDKERNMDTVGNSPDVQHLDNVAGTLSHALRFDDKEQMFTFVERKMTNISLDNPLEFSKKKLTAWTTMTNPRSFITMALMSMCGRRDLETVLLVICPSTKCGCHRMHIFCSISRDHLGTVKVTTEETDLLESHHSPDNYSIAYCSLPLTLTDLAGKSVIKDQIFDLVRNQSQTQWHSFYQGQPICLSYKSSTCSSFQSFTRTIFPNDKGTRNPLIAETFEQRSLFLESQHQMKQKKALQSRMIIKERQTQVRVVAKKIRFNQKHPSCRLHVAPEPVKRLSGRKKSSHPSSPVTSVSGSNTQNDITSTDDVQAAFIAPKKQDQRKEEDRTQLKLSNSSRRLPFRRNFGLRQPNSYIVLKSISEETLHETPHRPTSKNIAAPLPKPRADKVPKNMEENRRSNHEEIQQTLLKSPRKLPSIRNTAMRQIKIQKKREEHSRKQQEQKKRASDISPTSNSVQSERVAEEDLKTQDQDMRSELEPSQETLPVAPLRLPFRRISVLHKAKADDIPKNIPDDGSKPEESQPTLPKSPDQLPSIHNTAMHLNKTNEVQMKREEHSPKQQEQNERALDISPASNSALNERVAEEDDLKTQDEDMRSEQESSQHSSPNTPLRLPFRGTSALRKPKADDVPKKIPVWGLKQKKSQPTLPMSTRRLPPKRNTAKAQNKTNEVEKKREEDRCKQQEPNKRALEFSSTRKSVLSKRVAVKDARNKQDEEMRSQQELNQQTLPKTPLRLPFRRTSVLRKEKADDIPKNKPDDGLKQEVSQPAQPLSPKRNTAKAQNKTNELQKKREEHKYRQREQIQRALAISPTRNSVLRKRVAEKAARKKQDEDMRSEQEPSQQTLPESPLRPPFRGTSALRKPKADDVPKNRAEQSRFRSRIPQPLGKSPHPLTYMCKYALQQTKTDEIQKQEEDRCKQQSDLSQRRSDEARRNRDEHSRSTEEHIPSSALPQYKADEVEEESQQTLPESPRRLTFIRNTCIGQTKVQKKRDEPRRKKQEQIQRAFHSCATGYSVLHKKAGEEAVRKNRDEDWRREQAQIKKMFYGLPKQQDKKIQDRSNTRHSSDQPGTAIRRKTRCCFVQTDTAVQTTQEDTGGTLQERVHTTLKESPSPLSETCGTTGMKYNFQQKRHKSSMEDRRELIKWVDNTKLLNIPELASKRMGGASTCRTLCRTARSSPNIFVNSARVSQKVVMHADPKSESLDSDKDKLVTLISPIKLVESVGDVPQVTLIPGIEYPKTIIGTSSTSFCRLYQPVQLPADFSPAACLHIRRKLHNLRISRAFCKFAYLVDVINSNPNPQIEHLMAFFQIAESIDLKMYARKIHCFSDSSTAEEPLRFRVECFVFEDRRDYIAAISLPSESLQRIKEFFPAIERNLHFIDDVYKLTKVPPIVAKCLKMALNAVESESLYHLIGEIIYAWRQPETTLLQLNSDT